MCKNNFGIGKTGVGVRIPTNIKCQSDEAKWNSPSRVTKYLSSYKDTNSIICLSSCLPAVRWTRKYLLGWGVETRLWGLGGALLYHGPYPVMEQIETPLATCSGGI